MKAALFGSTRYLGPATMDEWPVPATTYSAEHAQRSYETVLDQFRMADETGFDWVTVAEHHFSPFSITPNPMVMAGALTQVVKRAHIALLGPDIPILNPVRVAEEFAMLDTLTGGRIIAGLMRGTPNEYVTYNINPAESRARFEEALLLIRMAWTEEQPFGWQGRFYEYRSVCIWPRPVKKTGLPMFMSGSSPESGAFAARNRIGLGFAVTTVPLASKAAAYYREQANIAGWTPTPDDIIYRCGFYVADTDEEAQEDLAYAAKNLPRLGNISTANPAVESAAADAGYYGLDIDNQRTRVSGRDLKGRVDLGQILIGSPETVISQIKNIRDNVGAGILDITLAAQLGDKSLKAIELFGTKVLPQIRDL